MGFTTGLSGEGSFFGRYRSFFRLCLYACKQEQGLSHQGEKEEIISSQVPFVREFFGVIESNIVASLWTQADVGTWRRWQDRVFCDRRSGRGGD